MTEAPRHPRDAEAFEYVLGSLPAGMRAGFAHELARDPDLAAVVGFWETRLAALAEEAGAPPLAPPADLYDRIADRIDDGGGATGQNIVQFLDLARLRRSRALWRGMAIGAASLAAALALWIGAGVLQPPQSDGRLVAVVNRSGDLPALIVRVDPRAGTVQVRQVSTEVPAGRSLELWSIVQGAAPRSLGLVQTGLTQAAIPHGQALGEGVTLAVSVEPAGGSRTGSPTGPVVYSGRLIPEPP